MTRAEQRLHELADALVTPQRFARPRSKRPGCGTRPYASDPILIVQEAVCAHFGVPVDALIGPSRRWRVCEPRHLAMWLARQLTPASLTQIGRAFGGRDHTTVLHAVRKVDGRIAAFPKFAAAVASMRAAAEASLAPEPT